MVLLSVPLIFRFLDYFAEKVQLLIWDQRLLYLLIFYKKYQTVYSKLCFSFNLIELFS